MTFRLELSVDGVEDAVAADALGGVDRIELCSAGALGGLTPGPGLLAATRARVRRAELHVLIRPRDGDFHYTPAEIDAMTADITHAVRAGASGVVVGALTRTGDLDVPALRALIAAADGLPVTLHRAFDVLRDPVPALDTLIGLGVARVLTSGGRPRAEDSTTELAALIRAAAGRITIMACGGIRPHNAGNIVVATGVRDLHAAPRTTPPAPTTGSAVDYGRHSCLDVPAATALAALARG